LDDKISYRGLRLEETGVGTDTDFNGRSGSDLAFEIGLQYAGLPLLGWTGSVEANAAKTLSEARMASTEVTETTQLGLWGRIKAGFGFGNGAASVASGMGGEILPATLVRTIQKGESIGALEVELAERTYASGGLEHAIVSLKSGERAIVSGGRGGIDFGSDLRRVIGHTHPFPTGPSEADFQMLRDTKQRHSYIYELFGGGRSRFNIKE
jgi:hypothetical protein